MHQKRTSNKLLFFLLLVLILGCKKESVKLPYYNSPDFTPIFLTDKKEIDKKITHKIADFSFENEDNQRITQKEVEGKIHVANFVFTTCGSICPYMTKQLFKAGKEFENDEEVVLLSFTVMPWVDTPEVLKKYKQEKKIKKKNWYFLTGNKGKIYDLARKSYFAEESLGFTKDSTDFLHTEHFLLVDKNKRIRGIYNGTLELEVDQLIKDINILKNE